ncbi:MAG: energy-converting hydrogenase Eha subunit E [Natronomonas sp.]|jgi:energy-converting hydrogenase Eha subunit E
MSYGGRQQNLDHARIAKFGFFAGVAMFLLGAVGEAIGRTMTRGIPEMANQLFISLEIVGVLVGLLIPLVFGIVLPLVE